MLSPQAGRGRTSPDPLPVRGDERGEGGRSSVMDFELSDEQRLLKDSVDRLLADSYSELRHRTVLQQNPKGYSAEVWRAYAELGLLGLPFPEHYGGMSQG